MLRFTWFVVVLMAACGGLRPAEAEIMMVPKPELAGLPDLRPRACVPPPADYKENVYREDRPAPLPTTEESSCGFILFSRPITRAIHHASVPTPEERITTLKTFATPGEFEPLTFALYALRDLQDLRVVVTPPRSPRQRIPLENLDLRLVTEWPIGHPAYTSNRQKTYRMTPELLEKVTVTDAKAGESRRYWLIIRVPDNARPGLYQGSFQIFDGQNSMAVELPFTLNVLDFKLLSDPNKGYTAYYADGSYMYNQAEGEKQLQFKRKEYQAMLDYGIDQIPNFNVKSIPGPDGSLDIDFMNPESIELMLSMGFKGPITVTNGFSPFYAKYVPEGKIGSHFSLTVIPANDDVYDAFSAAVRRFREKYQAKGWPEIVMGPVDEPMPETAGVVAKILQAVKKGGLRSYLTKDPVAGDAAIFRQANALDIWCSQPFSLPYEQIIADRTAEYWCYPNHNATEVRDTLVMQKGGRMTFGYGFWRSGYKVLIPWHWRWLTVRGKEFEYLFEERPSGSGNRMDEEGNIIPAVYWECFREGKDDARYLYTLQQTLVERRDSRNRTCRELVSQGEKLLQEIWDNLPVQQKYLGYNVWNDSQFDVYRWKIANLISDLRRQRPVNRKAVAPSVLARTGKTTGKSAAADIFTSPDVEKLTLGANDFSGWVPQNSEITAAVMETGDPILPGRFQRLTVQVDHKIDGGGESGKYPVGWPRTRKTFALGEIIMNNYDYLAFKVRIDSNRNEVEDDNTPITINFRHHPGPEGTVPGKDFRFDLGGEQRLWLTKVIPVRDMLAGIPADNLSLAHLQFVVSESNYQHGTRLVFDLHEMALFRNKYPVIENVDVAGAIFLPASRLLLPISLLGRPSPEFTVTATLTNSKGKLLAQVSQALTAEDRAPRLNLPLPPLPAAAYQLEVSIRDAKGTILSSLTQTLEALPYF